MISTSRASRLRYERAARMLNDTTMAARFERARIALSASSEPDGAMLSSGSSLAGAKRVGLFAGSFNPLTRAHAALAAAARSAGDLDALIWILTVVTVDKERVERASLVDRLIQMRAYVETTGDELALLNRGLYADEVDIAGDFAPSVDEFVVIVGYDKIVQILDHRYYLDRDAALDRLFRHARLLVAPRQDETEADLDALLQVAENRRYAGRITFCALPRRFRGESSSAARDLAGSGGSAARLRVLVPPEGRALVAETAAYARDGSGSSLTQAARDTYALRQQMIAAVGGLSVAQTETAPGLDQLVAAAQSPGVAPDEVVRWEQSVGLVASA